MVIKKHIMKHNTKHNTKHNAKHNRFIFPKSRKNKIYQNKTKKTKNTKKTNKTNTSKAQQPIILLKDNQVELLLLFSTLVNYFILLRNSNASRYIYKNKIIELLKDLRNNNKFIPNNTTDKQIIALYDHIYIVFTNLIKDLENLEKQHNLEINTRIHTLTHRTNHRGGFYFKNLEEKGDQPITGADLTKLLDEVQQFFYNAKYTSEGKFLQDTDTVLSMLRGDVNQFKSILQYRIFPKYYTAYPPFIKWSGIKEAIDEKKWEDIPDYLLAYQSYLRSRDEYLVAKGLKSPSVLQKDLYTGFYNKLANSLDTNIQQFQQYRNKFQGNYFPITMPP
jgi:hypothetical protein